MAYTFKHNDRPLDDFTVQRAVGTGGFGEVYYAMSDGGREVALKYLKANPQIELRGVSHCINLKSPHLVAIFDVKKNADDEYFVIMEYCSGPSLRDLMIAEPNGFAPEKAAFFVREIAKGLAYLHDRGIVHRDLKPGNIFYDDGYVKIGDYGLSKFISVSRHSAQTASVGTVHYMAPEIGSGNYSRGVDIYALGVMLYEMLLGRVPFEGSSMGEILMKHLTAQPELDDLPAPFGQVIRRALQKDPKDRYQTADEMVEDLLQMDTVKESLAGFSPQSLQGAVQHGGPPAYPSPMPSPNPIPGGMGGAPRSPQPRKRRPTRQIGRPGVPLPKAVAKKVDRISRKLNKKIAKLGGRPLSPESRQDGPFVSPRVSAGFPRGGAPEHRRRILLSLIVSAAIAVGLGFLVGGNTEAAAGISSGFMVLAMSAGLAMSGPAIRWFAAEQGPRWATRIITGGCCALPMFLTAIPMFAAPSGNRGLPIMTALLAIIMFGNWNREFAVAQTGHLRLGLAFWTGLATLILAAISANIMEIGREEDIMFIAAGIACATSLVIQLNAWWLPVRGFVGATKRTSSQDADGTDKEADVFESGEDQPYGEQASHHRWNRGEHETQQTSSSTNETRSTLDPNAPIPRWGVTRAFWGIFSFVMMSGTIVQALVLGMMPSLHPDKQTGVIMGMIATTSVLIFGIRRTTPYRRPGFWRESGRPLVLSIQMFGIGALITALSRFGHIARDGERVAMVAGLVMCSIMFLVVFFFTGGKPRRPRAFVHIGTDPVQLFHSVQDDLAELTGSEEKRESPQ